NDPAALAAEVARETSAIAAGPFDSECRDGTKAISPGQQRGIALRVGRDLEVTEVTSQLVLGVAGVAVLVRVDAYGDVELFMCDACYCHPVLLSCLGHRWSTPGRADSTAVGLCQPPIGSL